MPVETAAVGRELFQLTQRTSQLKFRMRRCKDINERIRLAMRIDGLCRTQRVLKNMHKSIFEKQMRLLRTSPDALSKNGGSLRRLAQVAVVSDPTLSQMEVTQAV